MQRRLPHARVSLGSTLLAFFLCAWFGPNPSLAMPSAAPSASASPEEPQPPSPFVSARPFASPLARGRSVFPARARPSASEAPRRVCSFSAPVCIHADTLAPDAALLRALASAERFFRAAYALGWPLPLEDGSFGGDRRYDIYLLAESPPLTTPDEIATGFSGDRAAAFSVLSPPTKEAGCAFDDLLARSIGQAIVLGLDAGAESAALAMVSSHLASIVTDCGIVDDAAVDLYQRMPERSLLSFGPDEPAGTFLFSRFLDDNFGTGLPGGVFLGLLAVSGQRTAPSSLEFANEPDVFDALRANVRAREKSLDDVLLDYAVDRAFVGDRSDGGHLSDVDRFGAFGRVRFEWVVPWASLPRRLAPMRPIEPTGSSYLWLDTRGAPENADFRFAADWELGVLFRFALVKVDASGLEMNRVVVAGVNGETHAERTLVGLRGVAGLLVVALNAGSIDRSHPIDPDEPPELARLYTVTLAP